MQHWGSSHSAINRLAVSQQQGAQACNKCLAFGCNAVRTRLSTGDIQHLLTIRRTRHPSHAEMRVRLYKVLMCGSLRGFPSPDHRESAGCYISVIHTDIQVTHFMMHFFSWCTVAQSHSSFESGISFSLWLFCQG